MDRFVCPSSGAVTQEIVIISRDHLASIPVLSRLVSIGFLHLNRVQEFQQQQEQNQIKFLGTSVSEVPRMSV